MPSKNIRLLAAAALVLVAVPAAAQFSDSYTFLKAVRDRDATKVSEYASNPNPSIINAREASSGDGALHILARGRDLRWLTYLLGRGARPDLQNNEGATPLIIAAQIGWEPGVEQLLARGADPNAANARGETALILAVQNRHLPIIRLLLARGADPNRTDILQGYSAIDYARQDPRAANILRVLETGQRP